MPVTPMNQQTLRDAQRIYRDDADMAVHAWKTPGDNPEWHRLMQDEMRRAMPVVTFFLDVAAYGYPVNRARLEE